MIPLIAFVGVTVIATIILFYANHRSTTKIVAEEPVISEVKEKSFEADLKKLTIKEQVVKADVVDKEVSETLKQHS